MAKGKVSTKARKVNEHRQDNPPEGVYPRYQWMSYWTPRNLRTGGKR